MPENLSSTITLANGVAMPRFGLGVFQMNDDKEVHQAVSWALEAGYRSIDTATIYHNETAVGQAIRDSTLPREQIFVTTKLWNSAQRQNRAAAAFDESLDRIGLDYVDLYLIHWPVEGHFQASWQALEAVYASGRARAIGVSNFMVQHLETLLPIVEITPMVNQIEFHPYLQSPDLVAFCAERGIVLEAWSPIMKGQVVDVPELQDIGQAHGKSAVQVALRWLWQRGIIAIPKSTHRERIIENAAIFDFTLSFQEMALIDSLDRGYRVGPDPYNFSF
jgi:diketogulonate reductase-like aldo/keto reductase